MTGTDPRDTDVNYAISVLLSAGSIVQTFEDESGRYWHVTPKRRTNPIIVEMDALVELAHIEARSRRDDWHRTMTNVEQLALFAGEATPAYTTAV